MPFAAIADRSRPKAERIAALNSLGDASLPPKSVFTVLYDESDDLDVRLAALRAVARSPGTLNQLVRRFHPAPLRGAAVAELERMARGPLPDYLAQRIDEDVAAARTDPLGSQLVNLGLMYGRDRRVLKAAARRWPIRDQRFGHGPSGYSHRSARSTG